MATSSILYQRAQIPDRDDNAINYHRLCLIDKQVSLIALKDVFELLWDKKYPTTPWGKDAGSVQLFEEKVKESKDRERTNRFKKIFDSNWKEYDWDMTKVVYALLDSKLFHSDLSVADSEGKPVSEHITDMRKIRNKIAHFTSCVFGDDEFSLLTDSMTANLRALELLKLKHFDASKFIRKLRDMKPQKEKERLEALITRKNTDKKYFKDKFLELDKNNDETGGKSDKDATTVELIKKYVELDSDFDHLNTIVCDIERADFGDIEQVQSKIDYLETIIVDLNITYSNKIIRISSSNNMRKEIMLQLQKLEWENKDLKDKLAIQRSEIEQLKQEMHKPAIYNLWLTQVSGSVKNILMNVAANWL